MSLQEIIAQFPTTPFIFAGSGITRRYYDLPDWRSLLLHFAKKVRGEDPFALRYYESMLDESVAPQDRLPAIASLIEKDFNLLWFTSDTSVRSGEPIVSEQVQNGASPFKAEAAHYLKSKSILVDSYKTEVDKLKRISKSNLSGIITTNYDTFFENICDGYKVFVGQDELVFSQIQGIAEIYKIHGCVTDPASIVINKEDYQVFKDKGKYLTAKLMTIFMEYPIIFIGYSMSDPDILSIIDDIVQCLPEDKIDVIEKRFVFVEYESSRKDVKITSHSVVVNGRIINMSKILLSDFGLLYDALSSKKSAFPVKLLRRFKDDLYSFALTNEPHATMRVADLGDERVDENTLALTIGLTSTGRFGLARAVNAEQWYRNIILQDLHYSADDMLQLVYPELAKQNSWNLPVWYYLREAKDKKNCTLALEKRALSYNSIVSEDSIKRNRKAVAGRSIMQVWNEEKSNFLRAIRIMGMLPEANVSVDELEIILHEIFEQNKNILLSLEGPNRSNLKKLIRIYDYIKYKTP